MDEARETRAKARENWAIRALPLRDESAPRAHDASARVASVWRITVDAWTLSGRPWPEYERADMPMRARRLGDD